MADKMTSYVKRPLRDRFVMAMIVDPQGGLGHMKLAALALLLVTLPTLVSALEVEFFESDDHIFSTDEQRFIEQLSASVEKEVRLLLQGLPEAIYLEVRTEVQPYTPSGASGAAIGADRVLWTVDASRDEGVIAIADATLRGILFHELHHLARRCVQSELPYQSFLDGAVCEGMATAFARDFGGAEQSWAGYPSEVEDWFYEVKDLPASATTGEWMFFHSDGRVRIGYKVGTYLVDRAMQATGMTSADLTDVSSEEIVRLAGFER